MKGVDSLKMNITIMNVNFTFMYYCGLYYKQVMIVNYTSSGVNKLKASLNDNARVVIYD
jgi:hypothetical protein